MMKVFNKTVLTGLFLGMMSAPVLAGGELRLYNESGVFIKPCFLFEGDTTWQDFGGLVVGTNFPWINMYEIAGGVPGGDEVVFDFTYVDFFTESCPDGPRAKIKGNHRQIVIMDEHENVVIQVGGDLTGLELEGPDEHGR